MKHMKVYESLGKAKIDVNLVSPSVVSIPNVNVELVNQSFIKEMPMKVDDSGSKLKLTSDAKREYLTLTAVEDNTTFFLFKRANPTITKDVDFQYSFDDGKTWTKYTMPDAGQQGEHIAIPKGKSVRLKGNNEVGGFNDCYWVNNFTNKLAYYIHGTGNYVAYGSLMSLVYGDNYMNYEDVPNEGCFGRLFQLNIAISAADLYIGSNNTKNNIQAIFYNHGVEGKLMYAKLTGNIYNESLVAAFSACQNLRCIDLTNVDTSHITSLYLSFSNCDTLQDIKGISSFNISNVNSIRQTFYGCLSLQKVNLTNWDVSNVLDMNNTFAHCHSLQTIGDISNWDVSNVTSMYGMFYMCYPLQTIGDISNWDVSNVTTFGYMFSQCYSLQTIGDISNWDISASISIEAMFKHCFNLVGNWDVSEWDVTNTTSMEYLFDTCPKLKLTGFKYWDVSNVTNMHAVFRRCIAINPDEFDFANWDMSKVTYISQFVANQESGDRPGDSAYVPEEGKWFPKNLLEMSIKRIMHLPTIMANANSTSMFKDCYKLTTIEAANTISGSIMVNDCPLTHDSIMVLINALDANASGQTLTLGSDNISKLSSEELTIATNKGWAIA